MSTFDIVEEITFFQNFSNSTGSLMQMLLSEGSSHLVSCADAPGKNGANKRLEICQKRDFNLTSQFSQMWVLINSVLLKLRQAAASLNATVSHSLVWPVGQCTWRWHTHWIPVLPSTHCIGSLLEEAKHHTSGQTTKLTLWEQSVN